MNRARRLLRQHWLLAVVLAAGTALRVLTVLAYRPAILYIDSFTYLANLGEFDPGGLRPIGYSLILEPLRPAQRARSP